jgi:hypothetical protein
MKRLSYLFTILSAITLLIACGPNIPQEKMDELSALDQRLDSVILLVESVDSARAVNAVGTFEKNLKIIQYELKDTFPRETAFFVDSYYRLKKALRNFAKDYNTLSSEIVISKRQLANLRNDAENGLVEEQQFNDYLVLEKENIDKLEEVSESIIIPMQKALPLFEEKNPRIDSLIQAYKAKQMNQ